MAKCLKCGKSFKRIRPWQKYHDDKCAALARRLRREARVRKALAMAEDAAVRDFGAVR
jgi:hypothetical protein